MRKGLIALALSGAAAFQPVSAANIAIFGENEIGVFLKTDLGHSVTYFTATQLETAVLSGFDLFVYTRDGTTFGESLTAAAATNVANVFRGNVALFTSDLADGVNVGGSSTANTLLANAVDFVDDNKGFIGEFTGACAAMESVDSAVALRPLGLIPGGSCDYLGDGGAVVDMYILQNHPIVSGVGSVGDTVPIGTGHQFFAGLSGLATDLIVATVEDENGIPSVVARSRQSIPEPGTIALLSLGLAGLALTRRRN